jgi:hypothetical protein
VGPSILHDRVYHPHNPSASTLLTLTHSYFASDITNRIFHELERIEPWEYIGINVVIGSLASIADGLLMVYLLNRSPVSLEHAGRVGTLAMILAIVVYWIIGTASKGTQIWNLVIQNSPPDSSDDGTTPSILTKSQTIFQDLDTVASGMQLLFAIGFAILARRYLNHLSQTGALRKRLSFAVSVLAIAFLVRNAVKFAFALVYSQLNKTAWLGTQLVYMAIYGPLSVVIFASIVAIAAMRGKEKESTASRVTTSTSYQKVPQQATASVSEIPDDRSYQSQFQYQKQQRSQYQGKAGVIMSAYPVTQDYEPYG